MTTSDMLEAAAPLAVRHRTGPALAGTNVPVRPRMLLVAIICAGLSGCGSHDNNAVIPPPIVETIVARMQPVPNVGELPGRIEAIRTAEIRAQSDGNVLRKLFDEGSIVKEGTPLFRLESDDYRQQVRAAEGVLQQAKAVRANAASVVRRYTGLVGDRAISGQEYDAAQSNLLQAQGQVTQAQAALARARITLDGATITAPISGRIGRAEVTEGAIVSAVQGTLMARIDQISPIYAVFSASSSMMLNLAEQRRDGQLKLASPASVTVKLVLENGTEYPIVGLVDFTGATVDPATGSQIVRAQFDNVDGLLAPGQFVRGRFEAGTIANGMMLPARAVHFNGDQPVISVLAPDGTVAARSITLGSMVGSQWIVRSGVRAGERVIVEGWQKVRPGQKAMDAVDARKALALASKRR